MSIGNFFSRKSYRHIMKFPAFDSSLNKQIIEHYDYTRLAAIGCALKRVVDGSIPGNVAECGVYKGETSWFLRRAVPQRTLYLFDTFEGFPGEKDDGRFKDTSVERVLAKIGDTRDVVVRKGRVPETFKGLENEKFAFVLLDMDIFEPTAAALEFFYPRLSKGGYVFVHDYNSDESDWACKRALDGFMRGKPEQVIDLSDHGGSALFRKY
jgi:O-methyltransferase